MLAYQDRLQGTDRLLRIRRIRKAAFAGLLALTVVLIAARLGSEGASLKPFFLPVNGIIEVSLIMGLVATFVGLYLRDLEIKNAQRDSQRYLMAKYSMTRAFRTAGFSLGIAVVLLLAVTPSVAAALFSDSPRIVPLLKNGQEVVTFTSPDPFGVTFVTHAVVTVTSGQASVTVLRNNMRGAARVVGRTPPDPGANEGVQPLRCAQPGVRRTRVRSQRDAESESGPAIRDGVQLHSGPAAASACPSPSSTRPRGRRRTGGARGAPAARAPTSRPSTGDARQPRDEGGRARERERARSGSRFVR